MADDDVLDRVKQLNDAGEVTPDDIDELIAVGYSLRAENRELQAENSRLTLRADAAGAAVSEILAVTLSGEEKRYRTDDGYVRWGRVERDMLAAIKGEDDGG